MASNGYNPYNYSYNQSSAQQYPVYQTASASNNAAQSSRQYQQPASTQAGDYMSYPASSYGTQGGAYGAGQDASWNGSNYGETRETTSRAAEVLRNMSNTNYRPNTTSANNHAGLPATNGTAPSRYTAGFTHSPHMQPQQPHPPHTTQTAYGQSQARPRSVNNNSHAQSAPHRDLPSPAMAARYPSQQAQTPYNQQHPRSASPAQPYSAAPASSAKSAIQIPATSQQHVDYNRRQLSSAESSRASNNSAASNAYNYTNNPVVAPPSIVSAPSVSVPDTYSAQSTTVDPMAVYDPWPEYQRKQDVIRAQQLAEDAARAEEETILEEARKAEEQKKEEERKRKEEEEQLRQPPPKAKGKKGQKQPASIAKASSAAPALAGGPGGALELEIRAVMAKMRELNSKDPALLARIWEEERRAKAPKSPATQTKSTPQTSVAPLAQAMPVSTPQVANSREKTAPREGNAASPAKPISVQALPVKPPASAASNQPGGNTIWPPEKRAHLATAAVAFLNTHNPSFSLDRSRILSMLDSNPSYIQLCEQLEHMGLKVDRAAFAKNLLTAVPDVNSASRKAAPQPAPVPIHRTIAPPAVMKREVTTPAAANSPYAQTVVPSTATSVPMAEMIAIKAELKKPANKEEAARKRNLSDLVDLTQLSDEDDMGPPPKRLDLDSRLSSGSPHPLNQDTIMLEPEPATTNFPIANIPHQIQVPMSQPARPPVSELRHLTIVENLDRKKALRRNNYNPATIARDVLLACGRHPSERQLNQHLDSLRATLPQISFDSDLSTVRWDLIDPGHPPPGYFKDSVQALTEDADDEEDSGDEERQSRPQVPSHASGESGAASRVQALPEAINPFKQKRRGRPPRHSYPDGAALPATPKRSVNSTTMSASAPRPTSAAAGVGYQAFRSAANYGPDGQPLPKKKGRPVGWRKAIHGSAAALSRPSANRFTGPSDPHHPSQPSSLRNVRTGGEEPIQIDSRSPSVMNHAPSGQSYKCQWHNCQAELHNLETLRKHVFKVHRKETVDNTLECLWGDCGKEVASHDPLMNMTIKRYSPQAFGLESNWRAHIEKSHVEPLSWELGDGPASGLSDAHDSEAYLSDAHGRQVTPRIRVDPERLTTEMSLPQVPASAPRGRGRPLKNAQEQEAHETHARLVSHKKRMGGPGLDRGGATLVNEKRRRGFEDSPDAEEELVDVED